MCLLAWLRCEQERDADGWTATLFRLVIAVDFDNKYQRRLAYYIVP